MNKIILLSAVMTLSKFVIAQPTAAVDTRPSEADIKTETRFVEAISQKVLENYDQAEIILSELTNKNPKVAHFHYELATVLEKRKQDKNAVSEAQKAYEIESTNSWYARYYADLLDKQARFKDAAMVYQSLIKLYPQEKSLYLDGGLAYIKAERPEDAVKIFNQLEAKIGINEEVSMRKFRLYAVLGKKKQAVEELEQLIKRFPTTLSYRHDLADYYAEINDQPSRQKVLQDILKIAPDDPTASLALAQNANQKGDEVAFLQSLKGLFSRVDVSSEQKIKQLAPYLEKMEQQPSPNLTKAVIECAEVMANTHPKDALVLSLYADLLYKNNQKTAALTQYKLSVEADKKRFYPWQYILIINAELKNWEELFAQSEKAMDYFPGQPLVFYMNAYSLYPKGKYQEAIDRLNETLPMLSNSPSMRMDVMHHLGRNYAALKQTNKAQDFYTKAFELGGEKDPTCLEHYGDFLAQINKIDEAVDFWQRAQRLGIRSETLQQKIVQRKLIE